jgi:hypothetical protein
MPPIGIFFEISWSSGFHVRRIYFSAHPGVLQSQFIAYLFYENEVGNKLGIYFWF